MITRFRWSSVEILIILSLGPAASAQTGALVEPGVVVEGVAKGTAAEKAGLQPGDVLVTWSREQAQGQIGTPFDLTEIEIEQGPQGEVTLRGRREAREQVWVLVPNEWGITARPALPADLSKLYQEGEELAKAGKTEEAVERWRQAVARLQNSSMTQPAAWLLSRIASTHVNGQNWTGAVEAYNSALALATRPGVRAQLLKGLAISFASRNEYEQAEPYFRQALAERQKSGAETLPFAYALNDLGHLAYIRRDLTIADEYFRQVLAIRERLGPGSHAHAVSLQVLGAVAMERDNLDAGHEYFRQALAIGEKLAPDAPVVAGTLGNLAVVALRRGDLAGAEEYHRRSLAIKERIEPGSFDVAIEFINLGVLAATRGDLARAEEYYLQALSIQEKVALGNINIPGILNNLGVLAYLRGDLNGAEHYNRLALAIREKRAPGNLEVAQSLANLGEIAMARGDLAKSADYYRQALAIQERVAPGSQEMAAYLNDTGNLAQRQGDFSEADKYLRRALAIAMTLAPESLQAAVILASLGELAEKQRNTAIAEEYHRRALTIREQLAPDSKSHAESLNSVGSILRRKGQPEAAAPLLSRSLAALESQVGRLGGTEDVRSQFRAQHTRYYRDYTDLLIDQNQTAAAFHVQERSRARSLLNLLSERDLVFASDLPPELERGRKLNAAAYDRTQVEITKLHPAKDAGQIEQLLTRLRELAAERGQFAEKIKKASPRFASLQYPEPLELAATQRALDPGTCLLTWSVGEKRTVLFVVEAQRGLSVFVLPVGEKGLREQTNEFRRLIQQRDARSRAELKRRARALYDLVIRPAEAQLAANERVLLIPDGPLHTLPFAALMRNEKQYFIEWKPLHTTLSATVYAELKKTRHSTRKAPVELVAFGDPQYPGMDTQSLEQTGHYEVRAAVKRGLPLTRLPFSRQEVGNIAAFYAGRNQIYLGAQATEERAKSLDRAVPYIHFATHGLLDERFPLNSAVVLTIPQKTAEGAQNGLLQAWEIFEQVRWDADLVVLSGCDTGLGQELSGEGLVGLTRALHYAGARSVVAALWKIEDRRTALLMEHFYRHLSKGASKDEALRSAQLALIRSPAASHPLFWAGFRLNGDWK